VTSQTGRSRARGRAAAASIALSILFLPGLASAQDDDAPPPPPPGLTNVPAGVTPVTAPTGAPTTGMMIGIFAPNEPWGSTDLENRYAVRMASHISVVTGIPLINGKLFANQGDFEAALAAKSIDFAVVDPLYLSMHPELKVLAQGGHDGKTSRTWGLYALTATTGVGLKGKSLVMPDVAGIEATFLSNVLLDGEMDVTKWFSATRVPAPDVTSAAQTVQLKRADAVFCPDEAQSGLAKVLETDQVPLAGFIVVNTKLPDSVVKAVGGAVTTWSGEPPIDLWQTSDGTPYRALRGRMAPRVKTPQMSEPGPASAPVLGIAPVAQTSYDFQDFGTPDDFYWRPSPIQGLSGPASQPAPNGGSGGAPATPAKPAAAPAKPAATPPASQPAAAPSAKVSAAGGKKKK
jgi:hypothetical protein